MKAAVALGVAIAATGCNLVLGIEDLSGSGGASSSSSGGATGSTGGAGCGCSCPGAVAWAEGLGSALADDATRIVVGSDGRVVVVGDLGGEITFGGDTFTPGVFVIELDSCGGYLRGASFNATSKAAVAIDADFNVIVTGAYTDGAQFGDTVYDGTGVFVVKLNANNLKPVWSRRIVAGNGNTALAGGVAVDNLGNALVVGEFLGTVDFESTIPPSTRTSVATGQDNSDIFVWGLKSNGDDTGSGAKPFGVPGATTNSAHGVTFDAASGDFVVTGHKQGPVKFGAMAESGGPGMFLARFDAAVTAGLSNSFLGGNGRTIASDGAGNLIVTGTTSAATELGPDIIQDSKVFVARFDSSLTPLFARQLVDAPSPSSATFDGDGNVVVMGTFAGTVNVLETDFTSAGATDVLVLKLSPTGDLLFGDRYGGTLDDAAGAVAAGVTGTFATGLFRDATSFGATSLLSAGDSDAWVAKLTP